MTISTLPASPSGEISHGDVRDKINEVIVDVNSRPVLQYFASFDKGNLAPSLLAGTSNLCLFSLITLPSDMVLKQIKFYVNGPIGTDSISAGIYSGNTLLASGTATSGSSFVNLTVTQTALPAGDYWVGIKGVDGTALLGYNPTVLDAALSQSLVYAPAGLPPNKSGATADSICPYIELRSF